MIVVAHVGQGAHDPNPRRIHRNDDHAMPPGAFAAGLGDAYHDDEPAVRSGNTVDVPLVTVDDLLIAITLDHGGNVGRIGGGNRRLRQKRERQKIAGRKPR